MNPTTPENTPETINVQAEQAPVIKSEENQANWRAFREQKEIERKARIEAERMAEQKTQEAAALKAALEAAVSRPSPQQDAQDENEESRMEKRIKEIILEREREYIHQRAEEERQQFPTKLRSVYKDFDKVCSTENLDYFEFHYPEVSAPFKYMPDGFDKWSAIYQSLKRFIPNTDSQKETSKADRNLQKPSSLAVPGASHGANAMPAARLTEERKAENWARMEKARKGLS